MQFDCVNRSGLNSVLDVFNDGPSFDLSARADFTSVRGQPLFTNAQPVANLPFITAARPGL